MHYNTLHYLNFFNYALIIKGIIKHKVIYFNKIIILINSNFKVAMYYGVLDVYLEDPEKVFLISNHTNCMIY